MILSDAEPRPPDGEGELDRGCLLAAEPPTDHEGEGVHRFEDRFHGQDGTAAHSWCRLGTSLAPYLSFGVLKREAHEFSTKVSARMRFAPHGLLGGRGGVPKTGALSSTERGAQDVDGSACGSLGPTRNRRSI